MPDSAAKAARLFVGRAAAHTLWLGPAGLVDLGGNPATPGEPLRFVDFQAWCARHAGQPCHLLLSSEWLTLMTSAADLNLRAAADVSAYAQAQFAQYHGADAGDWPLVSWRSAIASGATAVRDGLLAGLAAQAAAGGVRLLSVQPVWTAVAAWAQAARPKADPPSQALLLLDESGLVTAVLSLQGQTKAVALRRRPADPAQSPAFEAALRSEWGLDSTCSTQWIHWPQDEAQLHALARQRPLPGNDFLDATRARRLPALALATALCVAAVAGWDAHEAWQAAQAARQGLEAAALATPVRPTASPADAANRLAEAALAATLMRPWPAVFAAAEATTGLQMHWLSFDHSGRELRLEALAPDIPTAWQAAASLGLQPGIFNAVLTHLQADASGVRFELRADWGDNPGPLR